MNLRERALDCLFPGRCPFCRAVLPWGEDFCAPCAKKLPRMVYRRFAVGGVPCCSPLPYEGVYAAAVKRYKYGKKRGCTHALAVLMMRTAAKSYDLQTIDVLTFVPEYRQASKRFNHAEELARACASLTGIPCVGILEKYRKNKPQQSLSLSCRAENVRNVYRIKDGVAVSDKRILVIDDIITSGNTLGECARILKNSGCREVICATVCTVLH